MVLHCCFLSVKSMKCASILGAINGLIVGFLRDFSISKGCFERESGPVFPKRFFNKQFQYLAFVARETAFKFPNFH